MEIDYKKLLNKLFFPQPTNILGIDFGGDQLRIVQLTIKKDKSEVTDYVLADIPAELRNNGLTQNTEEMIAFVHDLFHKYGFSAKHVVFTVGGRTAFVRGITMPPMPDNEMEQAILWDSGQYVPYEADSFYVDFAKYDQINGEGLQPVILAAAPKEVIDSLVAIGDALELEIIKIDIEVLSIYRTLDKSLQNFLLLDIGKNVSLLSIFQNGAPVAQRTIPQGAMSLSAVLAEKNNISLVQADEAITQKNFFVDNSAENNETAENLRSVAQEILQECRRTSEYYIMNKKDAVFSHLVVVGSGAAVMGLAEFMQDAVDFKVIKPDILSVVNFDSKFEKRKITKIAGSLIVAIGAALNGGDAND